MASARVPPAPPDPWLLRCAPVLCPGAGPLLDLACGAGHNALWLARLGHRVMGVDASPERIAQARAAAQEEGPGAATFTVQQVAAGTLPTGPWGGICVFHFLDRELFAELPQALLPGGWLLLKTHLDHPLRNPGSSPHNPAYRLAPGELYRAFPRLRPIDYQEWTEDGRAWAGLCARREDYSS